MFIATSQICTFGLKYRSLQQEIKESQEPLQNKGMR